MGQGQELEEILVDRKDGIFFVRGQRVDSIERVVAVVAVLASFSGDAQLAYGTGITQEQKRHIEGMYARSRPSLKGSRDSDSDPDTSEKDDMTDPDRYA